MIEHLPTMNESLGSIFSFAKKRWGEGEEEGMGLKSQIWMVLP
jgi:hypothetical protein